MEAKIWDGKPYNLPAIEKKLAELFPYERIKSVIKNIVKITASYISENGLQSVVFGVSGGVDSAVICGLMKDVQTVLNEKYNYQIEVIPMILPCHSKAVDERLAREVCQHFGFTPQKNDLSKIYDSFFKEELADHEPNKHAEDSQKHAFKIRCGNIKARLRMAKLYDTAQRSHGIVISTDNKTEELLGFWTLHGDVGDYCPIQKLFKYEVYQIARDYEIPAGIIERQPTDGLGISSSDEEQIGLPYSVVDYLFYHLAQEVFFDFTPESKEQQSKSQQELEKIVKQEPYALVSHEAIQKLIDSRVFSTAFKRRNPLSIPRNLIIT